MTGASNTPFTLSGRYRVERQLGRGAMGAVYLARDLKHGREVAVKVLAPEATHALDAERFLSEVRTAAALNHPHILSVHDSGEENGTLYYVMPRIEGESLQDLLDREGRLSCARAVDLACQVAAGLAYAHAHGVIHRDIKPGNILLDRTGHAYIADFGLALALTSISSTRRTVAGVAVGSPLYMSPEQAAGHADPDARSDIYALGCVLYEMLAGEPPFHAGSVREILVLHLTAPPPSLRSRRADVPPPLERTVRTALAKDPAERQPTAEAFSRALQLGASGAAAPPERRYRPRRPRRSWMWMGLAAAVVIVVAVALRMTPSVGPLFGGVELDTTRYAILPFQREPGVPTLLREDLQLHEAFEGWRELQLVSRLQVGDAVQRTDGGEMTPARALDVARRLGAGRYVFGGVAVVGDSARLDASLHDATADGRELSRASIRVPLREVVPAGEASELASLLLFGRFSGGAASAGGTSSVRARRAYGDGHAAVSAWNLPRADSLFEAAAGHDPSFVRAHLWLAQVRNWAGALPANWRIPAERAARDLAALSPYEQALARALERMANGDFAAACEGYDALRQRDDGDFAAWYGLGECRRLDDAVVADPGTPSGWRFRSSYHQAVEAYRRAFETLPLTHRGATFDQVLTLFYTRPNTVRLGRGGEMPFAAFPALHDDTLVFVPYSSPGASEELGRLRRHPATTAALLHQRQIARELAERWAAAYPGSPDALEALAISLDMMGDAQAVDTYLRARGQSGDPAQRVRLALGELWARVKFGVPEHTADLIAAREIADSILAGPEMLPRPNGRLAALAVLVGDPRSAAAHSRADAVTTQWPVEVPRSVNATANALLAFAAAGGPTDSIAALEAEVWSAIRNTIPAAQHGLVRQQLLERPALLASPVYQSRVFEVDFAFTAEVGEAHSALVRGDVIRALELALELLPATGTEESEMLGNVSFDMLYPLAWLLSALGDSAAAAARLDAGFAALPWIQPGILDDPAHAGGLVRAIALRARLAALAGDERTAGLWRAAFDALWAGAAPELRRAALRTPTPPQRESTAAHLSPGGDHAARRPR